MGWYDNGDGMMHNNGYAFFGVAIMVLLIAILVWVVVRAFDHGPRYGRHGEHPRPEHRSSEALAHLDMRLAKGEITGDEYAAIKEHLKR